MKLSSVNLACIWLFCARDQIGYTLKGYILGFTRTLNVRVKIKVYLGFCSFMQTLLRKAIYKKGGSGISSIIGKILWILWCVCRKKVFLVCTRIVLTVTKLKFLKKDGCIGNADKTFLLFFQASQLTIHQAIGQRCLIG